MRFTEQTWAVVILLAVGCVTFSQPLFRHFMLDVRSVQVSNAFDGFDHALTVDREIHRPGPYTWSISFVRAERPRHSVYTAERAVPFPYVVTEDGDTLITRTLTWWIGGEDELRNARSAGFGPGTWQIETCHYAFGGLWYSCTPSNVFVVYEEPTP